MNLNPADSFRFSRKVGYGLRPDENPGDVLDWAIAQMEAVTTSVGIAHYREPTVVPWPAKYNWSLEERVAHLVAYKKASDKLDKQKNVTNDQRDDLENRHHQRLYDILRHCTDAVYTTAPVFERFANFWANHFTVGENSESTMVVGHYTDAAIKANMVRDFAAMLYDVETHPAMLSYLDAQYSIGPHSHLGLEFHAQGKYADINENLAREMLELHTISPKAGYTQADITNVAKVLTGWGYTMQLPADHDFPPKERWRVFRKNWHEPGTKTVLGQTIPQGQGGLRVLTDFLAARAEARDFISFKLAHHFIREEPTANDVAVISKAWQDGKGDLPTIHKAVLQLAATETEARKFMQPECWLFQMIRMSGATLFRGFEELDDAGDNQIDRRSDKILTELGQNNWSIRQPDGFSDKRVDWVSPEHMERRVRFAQIVRIGGKPTLDADAVADRYMATPETRALVGKAQDGVGKFTLLFCSPEFTEA
ncbi:MAG TPA: DUF1800 family protein [Bauldia sp.]|nr:DUF1800 family protein [Bauldia sp.]